MSVSHLDVYVEEISMKVFLEAWLKKWLPEECTFEIFPYQGKHALLRKLPDRLNAYATWMQA